MGRSSKYTPKFADQLTEYFSVAPYRPVVKTITEKTDAGEKSAEIPVTDSSGKPVLEASDFPSLAGFALKIGVHRDTLHEWGKNFAEFSDALKRAKDSQENWLLVNSLKGLLPAANAIFTQKNVLGYRDKHPDEVDLVINNHALSDEQLDNRIDALMKAKPKTTGLENEKTDSKKISATAGSKKTSDAKR